MLTFLCLWAWCHPSKRSPGCSAQRRGFAWEGFPSGTTPSTAALRSGLLTQPRMRYEGSFNESPWETRFHAARWSVAEAV